MDETEAPSSVNSLQQGNHPLSRKLKKILDTRLDNDKVNYCIFFNNLNLIWIYTSKFVLFKVSTSILQLNRREAGLN